MEERVLYSASGELMQGFLGNIVYETVLPRSVRELEIEVSFARREKESPTEADRAACRTAWLQNMGSEPGEEHVDRMIAGQKTEINVSVCHDGVQLGCAHRDETVKKIVIGPNAASDGFRPWRLEGGVLRVALHVFQLLNDHTPYQVIVRERGCAE